MARASLPPSLKFVSQLDEDWEDLQLRSTGKRATAWLALGYEDVERFLRSIEGESERKFSWHLEGNFEDPVAEFVVKRAAYILCRWFEDIWGQIAAPFHKLVSNVLYLSAVRSRPERIVFRNPRDLFAKQRKRHAPQPTTWISQKNAVERANDWLRRHKLLTGSIQLRYAKGIPLLEDRDRRVKLTFDEVGFGLSQFLPVLLACFEQQDYYGSGPSGTLLVEEPEAHIHPALQSEIGNLFSDAVTRAEHPLAHIICETHSEHILLRLQRLVRNNELSPNQVAVLYVENLGKESVVTEMRMDERGGLIRDWPGGFFQEGLREVLE